MDYWEVVGGVDKGGILVRSSKETTSPQDPERLSTGAIVQQLSLQGDRLNYVRVAGSGPASGWVSIKLKGKDLLLRVEDEGSGEEEDAEDRPSEPPFYVGGDAPTGETTWLRMLGKPKPDAKCRLVIFPWTGNRGGQGSAHNFSKSVSPQWKEILCDFEMFEVMWPGRGARLKEAKVDRCPLLARVLASELEKSLAGGKPFVFLGFSFGAVVAFECARRLQNHVPLGLVVVSAEGPSWTGREDLGLAKLNVGQFEKMLWEKGGTEFILRDPQMKEIMVPIIKADIVLEETYLRPKGKVRCPVLAFHGTLDGHDKMKTVVQEAEARLWLDATHYESLSRVESLPVDWYVFQFPEGCEAVAHGIADFMKFV
eukprot:CAMPEP_0194541766 /NCGR_PEP_ID=MMETSP0253-20130528/82760_1 /TAXON_ID=2966 /ORGANISM="Noctiluca scintillans" /LENGTH=368 /DNA_ID=CAMNT_0039388299 /DNA_START=22 /DNA_END=1128 /DNA_ORIENTATION=+